MLIVKDLNAGYGSLQILSGASFTANKNEITVIVGPNGSGKSTLLKTIFGLTTIYDGTITVEGQSLVGLPPHSVARKGIAYLPQVQNIFPSLTVEENLKMAGYAVPSRELQGRMMDAAQIFPVIAERFNSKSSNLSGGERQMVAMGMALLRRPKLMLMDEPTGALAPKIALSVLSKIVEIRRDLGIAIVLVEQNARRALEIGDRACLMVSGKSAFEGAANELLAHPQLASMYLGVSAVEQNKDQQTSSREKTASNFGSQGKR